MERFGGNGRWIIPFHDRRIIKERYKESEVRYVITSAYCPSGCSVIDLNHKINGEPGLRIKFRREGMEGELILSAIEGDFEKKILSGELEDGVKDDLYCPHCGTLFKKLLNCGCRPDSDMVIIGLTPEIDFNNAVTFCNVTGCEKGTFVSAGEVLQHLRLKESY